MAVLTDVQAQAIIQAYKDGKAIQHNAEGVSWNPFHETTASTIAVDYDVELPTAPYPENETLIWTRQKPAGDPIPVVAIVPSMILINDGGTIRTMSFSCGCENCEFSYDQESWFDFCGSNS